MNNRRAFTLVEVLVSIFLLSMLLVSTLAAFYISRLTVKHAKHRIEAMNIIKQYMEYEIKFGGGYTTNNGFGNPNIVSADPDTPIVSPIDVTIEGDPTTEADDIPAIVTPEPYYQYNLEDAAGDRLSFPAEGFEYRIIGFVIRWNEPLLSGGV